MPACTALNPKGTVPALLASAHPAAAHWHHTRVGTARAKHPAAPGAAPGMQPPHPNNAAPRKQPSQPDGGPAPADRKSANNVVPKEVQEEPFVWHQAWYPLAPVSYLSRSRPAAFTVLGRRMVVWFHSPTQSWRALADQCPHRLAPLSEGRVDPVTGSLQCSYHGWEFDARGQCTRIPQADSWQQERGACSSGRSCVASFPVRQEQGLLWVWPDSGPDAHTASARCQLPLPAELRPGMTSAGEPSGLLLGDWYMRDLPVSVEYLLENLLDPAHVHFAHHGLIGSRDRAGSIYLEQQGGVTAHGGFKLCMTQLLRGSGLSPGGHINTLSRGSNKGSTTSSMTHFVPPGLCWLEMPAGNGHMSMLFYAVPVSPGASRIFAGYSTDAVPPALRGLLQSAAVAPLLHTLQFLGDLGAHEIIDGDLIHIYEQEQAVLQDSPDWHHAYFMPTASDRGVVLLRHWLHAKAGGGPDYGPPPGAQAQTAAAYRPLKLLSRREILDRYEQHTRTCPSCRQAWGAVRAARQLLKAVVVSGGSAAVALAVVQALVQPSTEFPGLPMLGMGRASLPLLLGTAALMAAVLEQSLSRLEHRFVFVDYIHPDKK